MKRILPIILFLTPITACFSQEKAIKYYSKNWRECKKEKAYYYREISYDATGKPKGIVRDYYISNKIQWEGKLLSEKPVVFDSICKWYYENGNIKEKAQYVKGKLNGEYSSYFQAGNPQFIATYSNDSLHGLITSYWGGKIVYSKSNYTHGKLNGERFEYNSIGTLYLKENYRNGYKEGEQKTYHENGKMFLIENYLDGKREGVFIRYDTTGIGINEKIHYKNDFYHGVYEVFYPYSGGKKEAKYYYWKGENNGPDTLWWENGNIKQINTYLKYGQLNNQKRFTRDGKPEPDTPGMYHNMADTLSVHIVKDNVACLYGFKNYKNKWVIFPQFTFITDCENGYFIVNQGQKSGVADRRGKIIIPLQYDNINPLMEGEGTTPRVLTGWFRFTENNLSGLINKEGKIILKPEYEQIRNLVHGFIVTKKNNLYGFADTAGYNITPRYKYLSSIYNFNGTYIVYSDEAPENALPSNRRFGLINSKADTIIPSFYDRIWINESLYSNQFIWVERNKKIGLYNFSGKKILDTLYTSPNPYSVPYYCPGIIIKDKKYTLVDCKGKILIPAEYDTIIKVTYNSFSGLKNISNALAIVKKNNLFGVLDTNGHLIIKEKYSRMQYIWDFARTENNNYYRIYFLAKLKNKYGVINEKDSVILPFEYDRAYVPTNSGAHDRVMLIKNDQVTSYIASDFSKQVNWLPYDKGIAKFCFSENYNEYKCGLMDEKGKVLLPPEYTIHDFNDGVATFQDKNGKTGVINDDGDIQFPIDSKFSAMSDFSNEYACVSNYNGKVGIINEQGKFIVDTIFDAVSYFDAAYNVCWIKPTIQGYTNDGDEMYADLSGNWGLINKNKKMLLDTIYSSPSTFHDSIAIVSRLIPYNEENDYFGFGLVHVNGKTIIPCEYQRITQQQNGLYFLQKSEKWGLADKNGKILISPQWNKVSNFLGNYAIFYVGDKAGLTDTKGNIIIKPGNNYIMEQKDLRDYISFYTADTDIESKDYRIKFNLEEISKIINGYELLDSVSNMGTKRIISNQAILLASANYMLDANYELNYNNEDVKTFYSVNKWSFDPYDLGSATEDYSMAITIASVNKMSFSIIEDINYCYSPPRGMGSCNYNTKFHNYSIRNDSIYPLTLDSLFNHSINYKSKLNGLIIENIKKLEDADIDCSNPETFIDKVDENFVIERDGIVFYLASKNENISLMDEDNLVKLTIPYESLKNIINKKSVLREFLKK